MSTKTTFKRIALVAVAALGFGVLTSVSPANATATASFTVNTDSVTVVTNGNTAAEVTLGALFKLTLRNEGATATDQSLESTENLSVTVVGVPAGDSSTAKTLGANASDLTITKRTLTADNGNVYGQAADTAAEWGSVASAAGTISFTSSDTAQKNNVSSAAGGSLANSYYFGVTPATDSVIGQGTYTLRLRLTSNSGALLVQDRLVKVTFVNGAVNSGAILTASAAGSFPAATVHNTYALTKHIRANITDANGGRIITEDTAGTHVVPDLTVDMVDKDGAAVTSAGLAEVNAGATSDHAYNGTLGDWASLAVQNASLWGDSNYGITATVDSFPVALIGATNQIRVRYGASSATAAITIINTATSATTGVASVLATGIPVTNVAPNYTLPLTTTAATVVVTGQTAGAAVVFTVTWATTATGNVSPKSATPQIVYADATGTATLALTNSAPVDTAKATVNVTGFATNPADTVITWTKSAPASITVDINGAYVALKSTNVATATVVDSFGAPVAGVQLTPLISGANASTTRTYAVVTTDAKGQASYTWTDALAVVDSATLGADTVKFTVLGATTNGSGVVTYAAAAPAVTTMTNFYNANPTTASGPTTITTAVPATGIYVNGVSTKFQVKVDRNNSKPITVGNGEDSLKIRVSTGVAGARIVATGTAGVWFLGAANLAAATDTEYTDALGNAYFVVGSTTAGANTVTFTSGAVTSSAAFWSESANANARFVTLTGPATGTANGDLNQYVVTVTDRFGNPMGSQTVSISASGSAVLGGGATVASYTTDSTGTFQFTGTSLNAAGGTGTYKVTVPTTNQFASIAGYSHTTAIDSTVAAGNNSATLTVTYAAGDSASASNAQAAADAAAEATDAANAATDAANAAAEAADAATAAAQDAADAVAALSTQVTELVSALRKQITSLTNLVIKIQRKVRA